MMPDGDDLTLDIWNTHYPTEENRAEFPGANTEEHWALGKCKRDSLARKRV